ncbi:uncharacterized protein LOC143793514 isoform X1 [Ranitomeya variabilis]|uniref:uncharacterized protein LOC143793514 isoform X1 n=1 Tax=Ranitomeya variabilis TaxID=490064 RepID=UPI0040564CBA
MGAQCALAYANIFLGWWEETIVYCSDSFKRHVQHWHRFIDDVFFVWTGTEQECLDFLNELNCNSLNIIPTHSFSSDSATFLDLKISIRNKDLVTDLYRKATVTNSLLSDHHQDGSVRFITDFNDQWNRKIYPSARGGDHRKRLLQIESRWIFNLRSLSPTGLNEELLFNSFLG